MTSLHKLSNGIEVLLEENHAAPVISIQILVKVGSAMENKKEAGISHVIEHMLFKGTPTRAVGDIAKDVESAGGEINAYTSFDQTVYYINMASRFAAKGLNILADAVQNPLFDKDELEKEKEVVLEEIRRENDNPSHRSSELMFAKSYKNHPYKNPIIGTSATVKSFTRKNLITYYKKWYTPHNISVIVVGDFNTKAMLKKIAAEFKGFKGKKPPQLRLPKEPAPKNASVYIEENPIHATYFSLSFLIPEITHKDIPALDILSHILAGINSARLPQEIKEKKQLVNSIYSYAFTPKHPGILLVGGVTTPKNLNKTLDATWEEIHKLQEKPVTNSELNSAKLIIKSMEIYERETTGGQASKYAYYMATAGTHQFEEKYFQAVQDIHVDDIKRVAQKYLVPKNSTLIVVHPKEAKAAFKQQHYKKLVAKSKPTLLSLKTARQHVASPVLHKLSNGIHLIIREDHTLPVVSCASAVLGGLRFETKKNNGINNLLAMTITKGTKNKSALEISREIESIAGSIDSFSGRNSFGLRAEFLSDKFDIGFGLFAEVLTEPGFAADEIERERLQTLDAIKNQEDALTSLAFMKFLDKLYPKHPYGLKMLGEKATVKKLTRKQLIDYYWKITTPGNLVIAVVGDVSPDEVIEMAEKKLKFIGKKAGPMPSPKAEKPPKKPILVTYKRAEKEQAHIVMGFLGPVLASDDHYTLGVINNILSGQGGRLFLKLRDEMSLAYAVSSTFFCGLEPGYFAVYIGTDPSKVDVALKAMQSELHLLLKKGVTKEELTRSKNHMIGTFELERQRNQSLAGSYAFNVLYGLGLDEIDEYPGKIMKITQKDILRVAKKYIRLSAPVTSIVHPE